MTPLPPWIHTDLKAEVLRDASLDGPLSLLDKELTVRVAHAFALHPWVAKVQRVSKRSPAGVQVDLDYRRPVAMVEVPGPALLPVDGEGVLLPTADFSPQDARQYPRIAEIKTSPLGPVGTRWGDTHVTGGARIAAALLDDWQALKLHQVVPAAPDRFSRRGNRHLRVVRPGRDASRLGPSAGGRNHNRSQGGQKDRALAIVCGPAWWLAGRSDRSAAARRSFGQQLDRRSSAGGSNVARATSGPVAVD